MFWWWQQKEPLNDEEAVKLGFKDGAEKKAAYARVDEQLVNPYQESLATIIKKSPTTDKKICLLAFNDNKEDRAIARLTAAEMRTQGVIVVTTSSLGPGFERVKCLAGTNVLKALEDPNQFNNLTDIEKKEFQRYKKALAVFLLSNESMGNSSFRNLHREHNLAGNRFASVRIGEFDAERVADYHNLNRAPGEPSMTEKEATEAIEEAKRVDHRLDNLFVATDGSERRNKKAAKDLTKEVSQLSGPPHNLKVYLDLDRMHENIHRNMQRNVSSSKYMVAMHNKLYASSRNCGSEFYTAKETGIPMAIVHVGDGPHHHLPADSSTIRIYSTENDTAEIVRQIAESATGTIPPAELINDQGTTLTRAELEEKGESLPAFKHADLVATNDAIERVTGKRTDIPPEVKPFLEGVKVVGVLYDETQETQAQELKGQLEAVSPGIEVKLCTVQDLEKGNQLPPKHDRSFVICENLEGDKEKNNMTGLYMNAQDSESVICIGTQKQVLQAAPELAGVTGVPMDNIPKINDLASFGTPQLCFSETSKRVKAVEDILRNFPFGENTTPVEAAKLLIKLVGAGALTDEQLRTCALAENMDPILDVFYDVTNDNDNLHRYSGIVTLIDGLANDYVNKDDFESADKRRQYCAYLVAAMGLSEGASKIIMAEYDRKLGDTTNTQNQTAAVNADNDENVNADEGELAT